MSLTFFPEIGVLCEKRFDSDEVAHVLPMLYENARIALFDVPGTGYENVWCYDSVDLAINALEAWDGEGEPTGWKRHPASGRRRINGDPATEYVNA